MSLTQNEVYNLEGLLPSWSKVKTYYEAEDPILVPQYRDETSTYCTQESAMGPEGSKCSSYFSLNLISSGRVVLRRRQYKSLIELLGTIGGVCGILSTIIGFIYSFINDRQRANFIMQNVYRMNIATKLVEQHDGRCCKLCRRKRKDRDDRRLTIVPSGTNAEIKHELSSKEEYERIRQSLDVINLVRDSCYLKVLVEALMTEKHRGLAQRMDIKLWKKQKSKSAGQNKDEDDSEKEVRIESMVVICNR